MRYSQRLSLTGNGLLSLTSYSLQVVSHKWLHRIQCIQRCMAPYYCPVAFRPPLLSRILNRILCGYYPVTRLLIIAFHSLTVLQRIESIERGQVNCKNLWSCTSNTAVTLPINALEELNMNGGGLDKPRKLHKSLVLEAPKIGALNNGLRRVTLRKCNFRMIGVFKFLWDFLCLIISIVSIG